MMEKVAAVIGAVVLSSAVVAAPVKISGWNPNPPGGNGKIVTVDGKSALRVVGTGDDDVRMLSPELSIVPGGNYILRFKSKSTAASGNLPCGVAGVNRDFAPTLDEKEYSFAFRTGNEVADKSVSLGQYHVPGSSDFYGVEVSTIQPIYRQSGDLKLGEGEYVAPGTYVDNHNYGWTGSTIHRTLYQFNCGFNSNRWVLGKDSHVIYRYDLPFQLKSAKVKINIPYYVAGKVTVMISQDGHDYTQIGELSKVSSGEFDVPASMFPSSKLYVMIATGSEDTTLQVDTYSLTAVTDYQGNPVNGKTNLVEEFRKSDKLEANWLSAGDSLSIKWENKTSKALSLSYVTNLNNKDSKSTAVTIPANGSRTTSIETPMKLGNQVLNIKMLSGKSPLYAARIEVKVGVLHNNDYGYRVKSQVKGLDVWWCESNWKVGPDRSVPKTTSKKILSLSACKGEYEAVQLVMKPGEKGVVLQNAAVSALSSGPNSIEPSSFTIYEVATVRVNNPTDSWGETGDHPDPLPVLDKSLSLADGRNQAIWISAYIPANQAAGKYTGKVTLTTNRGDVVVPFEVTVYDFSIPKSSHLRSALGISDGVFGLYNKTKTKEQNMELFDKWMYNFAEHRISPYSFFPYSPIGFEIVGDPDNRRVKLDWTEFDKAAKKYLDGYNLSSFALPIQGLGGGTFYDRSIGELDGNKAGTPEYEKLMADYLGQLENHLKENGWLDKAYVYWFDEPDEKDYEFVNDVMKRIKKYAPGLKRLLTEQPEKALIGNVDIWVGLTSMWNKKAIDERNAAGDDVWWYICCGPQTPYVGEFIDHPGTEMRMWIWQTWQYNVHGILIWTTNWWTSGTAFPDTLQNPWEDAMSYVDGYGTPKGTKLFWGNGDGRFLYPPRRDPNTAVDTDLSAPVTSTRWEALMDGMEDYEYFYLLKDLINKKGDKIPADVKTRAQRLLTIPEAISKDMVTYTCDPRLMLEHRDKIAHMIEKLQKF